MLEKEAIAVEFSKKAYGSFYLIMPVFVACSTLGSANGVIFTSSRLFYVGARKGQMPQLLTMVNPTTRTPIPAVILTVSNTVLFCLLFRVCSLVVIWFCQTMSSNLSITFKLVTGWLLLVQLLLCFTSELLYLMLLVQLK